jgi:hypothetical protein
VPKVEGMRIQETEASRQKGTTKQKNQSRKHESRKARKREAEKTLIPQKAPREAGLFVEHWSFSLRASLKARRTRGVYFDRICSG